MSITGRQHLWTGFFVSVVLISLTSVLWILLILSVNEGSLFLQRYRLSYVWIGIRVNCYFTILKMVLFENDSETLSKHIYVLFFFFLSLFCYVCNLMCSFTDSLRFCYLSPRYTTFKVYVKFSDR